MEATARLANAKEMSRKRKEREEEIEEVIACLANASEED